LTVSELNRQNTETRDNSDWGSCRGGAGLTRLKTERVFDLGHDSRNGRTGLRQNAILKGSGAAAWLRLCGRPSAPPRIMGELPPPVGHIAVAEPAATGVPNLLSEPRLGENPQYPSDYAPQEF
jgi:hypothetical protein